MKKIALAALLLAASFSGAAGAGYDNLNIGIQYANDEAWDNAILWLDKAINAGDLLPDQMRAARYNRALAYASTNRPGLAIPDFTAALAVTPYNVPLLTQRAFAYIADGQGDRAVADVKLVHEKRPKNAQIDYLMGVVNWALGRPQDASPAFADALKESKNPYAWMWLKLSDMKQGKQTDDYVAYSTYYWPGPVADLYRGRKDESDVLDRVKEYGESESCDAVFYIAEWRLAHNDTAAAKPMFQKAVSDCPKDNLELLVARMELEKLK